MSFGEINPEGADLGRSHMITAYEMTIVAPHIAGIMQTLHNQHTLFWDGPAPQFKYAFELSGYESQLVSRAIADIERELPKNVHWYEVDGKKLFELRGPSGGVSTGVVCYLYSDAEVTNGLQKDENS